MMMYYIDKKPLKEIAKILNTTPAYVKQILYKSRLLLQEKAKSLSSDGKLYKPKNDKEWEILTLAMFISDNHAPDEMKNYTNLLRASDI